MTHDPYTPPTAQVRDARSTPVVLPSSVVAAVLLLAFSAALGIVSEIRWYVGVAARVAPTALLIALVLPTAMAVLVFHIARRRNWARIVMAVYVAGSLASFLFDFATMESRVPEGVRMLYDRRAVLVQALPHVANVIALVLLFWPARQWFRRSD